MKSYTDIEQSKKLAEILPIESADMRYGYIAPYDYSDRKYDGGYDEVPYPKDFLIKNPNFSANEYDGELPCWSLGALLESMPIIHKDFDTYLPHIVKGVESWGKKSPTLWYCTYMLTSDGEVELQSFCDLNPTIAAYDMICWLLEEGYIKKGK